AAGRFAELSHGSQVGEEAEGAVFGHRDLGVACFRKLGWQLFEAAFGDSRRVLDPAPRLRKRDANRVAAAFVSPARQANASYESRTVARGVVERVRRGARQPILAVLEGNATDVLHNAVEAATARPWTGVAEGAEADIDDARAQLGDVLRPETSSLQ